MPFTAVLSFSDLRFDWPDGSIALDALTGAIGPGVTGLVGRNGAGKTTLLRLIGGELHPTGGSLSVHGTVTTLPQHLGLDTERTIADALGIRPILDAIERVTAGDVDERHFDTIGERWDVEAEAVAALGALGLQGDEGDVPLLDRRLGSLSGGEAVLVGLAAVQLSGADIALLDEPTNNLDRDAKRRLIDAIAAWRGTLLVVSHDRDLLARVDRIAELHGHTLRTFDGPYEVYEQAIAAEQHAARHAVRDAEALVRKERQERIEANEKRQRAMAAGRRKAAKGGAPKILLHAAKGRAEQTTAASKRLHEGREQDAKSALDDAARAVREDASVRIDLPGTHVAAGRRVLELVTDSGETLTVRGPERIALDGPNGAGKSTLLGAIMAWPGTPDRAAVARVRSRIPEVGLLGQRLADFDDDDTLVEALARTATSSTPGELRSLLARFLFRGSRGDQRVAELSGGERVRLGLARVLCATPAPQLLLLDEPTNSLDLDSLAALESALAAYEGALIVVSHDQTFLDRIGLTRRWMIDGPVLRDGSA